MPAPEIVVPDQGQTWKIRYWEHEEKMKMSLNAQCAAHHEIDLNKYPCLTHTHREVGIYCGGSLNFAVSVLEV